MTSYVNIFEDMDFMMNLLAGAYDDKIKKGKMKISYVYSEPKEVDTIEEVVDIEPEPVEVDTIEEVMGIGPVIDEDEDEVFAPKCTDIEKAIAVLDGTCTDMDSEDFDSEVWAEANELYYSMEDVDYAEEEELGVGTVISMSNKGLGEFFNARINSIESWDEDETEWNEGAESEYIYEDDEVNVVEECDVTIFSFAKAFSCMMPRVA